MNIKLLNHLLSQPAAITWHLWNIIDFLILPAVVIFLAYKVIFRGKKLSKNKKILAVFLGIFLIPIVAWLGLLLAFKFLILINK
jgi:hypothetical protein